MELKIIEYIQQFRTPYLDWFFYFVTELGDQFVLIAMIAIVYWTMSKKYAHLFLIAFMVSALVNVSLKELFMRPRPFDLGIEPPTLPWIGEIKTHGYAFPSGHANTAGVLGYIGIETSQRFKMKWLLYISIFIMIFVPISRLYLAQHYISDIVVGLFLGFIITYLIFKKIKFTNDQEHLITVAAAIIGLLSLIFIHHADYIIAVSGLSGFAFGYAIEKKYVKFNVYDSFMKQVSKVLLGLIVIVILKEGLKFVFPETIWFDFIRYFIIGGWVSLVGPWIFKHVFKSHS